MSALSPEQRDRLLLSTRPAAAALVDDLSYIRDLLTRLLHAKDVGSLPGEVRRLSATIRRLLVERDLTIVAAPRIGRFFFDAPDIKRIIKGEGKIPFAFFASGGAELFGISVKCMILEEGNFQRDFADFDPDKSIKLQLDGFLSQPVLCLDGQWIRRGSIIKYVANVASGVHSGLPREPEDAIINNIRRHGLYSVRNGEVRFGLDGGPLLSLPSNTFVYRPDNIDPVLVELISAAHYVAKSEDTDRLEAIIAEELGQSTTLIWPA
jgi:hypothetical protein